MKTGSTRNLSLSLLVDLSKDSDNKMKDNEPEQERSLFQKFHMHKEAEKKPEVILRLSQAWTPSLQCP